jgi:hypothetical protein
VYIGRIPGRLSSSVERSEAKRNEVAGWLVRERESSLEGWQLSRALQGRLRRDYITELTVDKSSVAGYSPNSDVMSAGS